MLYLCIGERFIGPIWIWDPFEVNRSRGSKISKGFHDNSFLYVKHCYDIDIVKGQCYNDRANEEGHANG
jgi:hypothetical protein